jgi:hypothetical protein
MDIISLERPFNVLLTWFPDVEAWYAAVSGRIVDVLDNLDVSWALPTSLSLLPITLCWMTTTHVHQLTVLVLQYHTHQSDSSLTVPHASVWQ